MNQMFSNDDCYMYKKASFQTDGHDCYLCSGGIDMSICGLSCPFRKTLEQQQAIENRIVERFKNEGIKLDYKSCITSEVLYKGTKV